MEKAAVACCDCTHDSSALDGGAVFWGGCFLYGCFFGGHFEFCLAPALSFAAFQCTIVEKRSVVGFVYVFVWAVGVRECDELDGEE